ncbi:septum formation initiator family protein [Weissella minor]|uniref:FtsB family cell division protein n=1 Tax=Weissella minor TaxID=1620 RepID=UPI001BAF4CA0|nr:septum formation initiator family protein [Weissella minor]MBS0950446.1 septum formation initiator family protein [Weissella minor]
MARYQSNQNIQPLNDAGQRALEVQALELEHHNKVHRRRRIVCGVMLLLITIMCAWQYQTRYVRYSAAVQSTQKEQKSLDAAKETNAKLKQTKKDLKNDDYLSKVARDRYLYSKEGEVVFNLPDDK